jgi:NAD(P)-dependent dehydrogenase (short-subunit alcohol dehydrogenase family)
MPEAIFDLSGRVAVITAGANGLGKYAAIALARHGADIAIGDIDSQSGAQVIAEIEALGRRALFVKMDALQVDAVENLVTRAAETFGRIDILVNNAGGTPRRNFMDSAERNWRRTIDLNFVSMLGATHAAVKFMRQGGRGGVIINVASTEALRGAPGYAVYAACKAAMSSFTQSMAVELADDGIRVCTLQPDLVRTDGLDRFGAETPHLTAERARIVPLGRVGEPREYSDLLVFLCSDMASYLTGIAVRVDGGALAAPGFHRTPGGDGWDLVNF